MGTLGKEEQSEQRKPRFLCLHGFRTSGEIMKKQIYKWPQCVLKKMDLIFLDAPFPAEGKSEVEGIFDPPYYEWFQFDKDFMEYRNFDECLAYIEECMIKHGPIDGLMGFSQGAILSAALPGLQAKIRLKGEAEGLNLRFQQSNSQQCKYLPKLATTTRTSFSQLGPLPALMYASQYFPQISELLRRLPYLCDFVNVEDQ
ncbi:hypothetical protein NE237_013496 [Protea cynaroides]|uniref:Serine hydrolase domain-containing protein n=1 Tax=Protea cynaroides TaxID=273540 RepID=A0A9Q0GZG7_9MAGN|nr:hypothetical protein NE237_013496 [Protea cynaroides]